MAALRSWLALCLLTPGSMTGLVGSLIEILTRSTLQTDRLNGPRKLGDLINNAEPLVVHHPPKTAAHRRQHEDSEIATRPKKGNAMQPVLARRFPSMTESH